jgi:iron complex transport system substrate-binding protein
VRVVRVPAVVDLDGARARVRQLAALVGAKSRGEALIAASDAALAAIPTLASRPKVAFVYARGAGTLLLAGRGTSVEALVVASGGTLAAPWEGFRPITAEAVVAAAPEVLLLTTRGLDSVGGIDGLLAIPGVAATPAGRARRVVAIDDLLLLTLGPRTPEAARLLHRALADVPAGSTP